LRIFNIKVFKYLIVLSVGLLLLYLAFRGQDIHQMISDLRKADLKWVFLAMLVSLIAHVIRAFRWNLMIGSLGHETPPLMSTFHAVIMGYIANLAFPRMGELARCTVINKSSNIPVDKLLGTVLVERLVDLVMLGLAFVMAVFFEYKLISGFLNKHLFGKLNGRIVEVALLILALLALFLIFIFLMAMIKKKNWRFFNTIFQFISGIKNGVVSIKNIDNKLLFLISSLIIWILYGLSSYFCFSALENTSSLGAGAALSTLVFGSLAMIAPVQGGIGAFHWMVSEGLLVYGISKIDGLTFALIFHTSQNLIILFIGSLSVILFLKSTTRKNHV